MPREKQIEFPPEQTQVRWIKPVSILFSLVCIVVVVILVLTVDGPFIGPW